VAMAEGPGFAVWQKPTMLLCRMRFNHSPYGRTPSPVPAEPDGDDGSAKATAAALWRHRLGLMPRTRGPGRAMLRFRSVSSRRGAAAARRDGSTGGRWGGSLVAIRVPHRDAAAAAPGPHDSGRARAARTGRYSGRRRARMAEGVLGAPRTLRGLLRAIFRASVTGLAARLGRAAAAAARWAARPAGGGPGRRQARRRGNFGRGNEG
jgi:hypothetical protein